jgi:hypothetical protein
MILICDNDALCASRETILEREGFEVDSFSSFEHPSGSLVKDADIAILCGSASTEVVSPVRERFRSFNPAIRILNLSLLRNRTIEGYGAAIFLRIVKIFTENTNLGARAAA